MAEDAVEHALNYVKTVFVDVQTFKDKQIEAISAIYSHKDVIVILPTGYGKSLIFQILPWLFQKKNDLLHPQIVIIVTPLNCIMEDQVRSLCKKGLPACFINVAGSGATTYHLRYTWMTSPDAMHLKHHCPNKVKSEFVPMINGHKRHISAYSNISDGSRYVLGFNEPDHAGSANLSVAEAVTMWKDLQLKYPGKVLVSPAVTNLNWLTEFFHSCHNCKVDHVAVHIYSCDAHHVMNKLKTMWNMFHKPIWLTEFACPHTDSADEQLRFMKEILPMLEASPHVFRYAWFVSRRLRDGWVHASVSLLKPDTTDLTPLGHYYNNFM